MRIQTKMLKRLISILCAATISSSCMITSVGAAHENEQVDQDNRSNSELQKEIDFWNKCLNQKMASGKAAMELRVRIHQLREQIKKHKKKQIELDKALENLKKEEEKFKKWSKKHNNSKRLVDLIGTIDCNSNAPFKASEADDIINKANKAIAKLQFHMSECEKQEKEEKQKINDRLAYEKAQKERTNNKRENNTQNKETIKNNIVSQTEEENGEYDAAVDEYNSAKSEYDAAVDEYNSAKRERYLAKRLIYSADVNIDMANIDLKAAKAEGNKNGIRKGYGKYILAKGKKTKAKDKYSAAIAKGKAAKEKIKCKKAEEKKLRISVVKGILRDLEKEIDTYNKFTIDNDKIVISSSDSEIGETMHYIINKDKMKLSELNKAELNKVRTPIVERVLKDYEENEKRYEYGILKKLMLGIFQHKCVDLLISEAINPRLKMVNILNNKDMNKIIIKDIKSQLETIKSKDKLDLDDVDLLYCIANTGMSLAESLINKRKEPSGLNHEERIELHSLVIMLKYTLKYTMEQMEQMKRIESYDTQIKNTLNDLNQLEEELKEELEEEQNERTKLIAKKFQSNIGRHLGKVKKIKAINYVKKLAEKAFLKQKKAFIKKLGKEELEKAAEIYRLSKIKKKYGEKATIFGRNIIIDIDEDDDNF